MRHATTFDNRQHAAHLLAEQLLRFQNSNAVIAAIPRGGLVTGYYLSEQLGLPLEVVSCKRLKNPADEQQSIGSVAASEVVIHESDHDIPQNYIYHQVRMLQHAAEKEQERYYQNRTRDSFGGKGVIVVDDFVETGDSVLAVLKEILRQQPRWIVVATPVIADEAIAVLSEVVNEVVYLESLRQLQSVKRCYLELQPVSDREAEKLFHEAGVVYEIHAE